MKNSLVALLFFCIPAWSDIVPLSSITGFQSFGTNTRVLAIYDASLFPGLTGIEIQEISFYSHGAPYGPFTAGESPIHLYLGTTSIPSAEISATYSDNISDGETLVYAGTVLPTANDAVEGFTMTLSLSSPFFYKPTNGNLLLDIQNTGANFMFPYDIAGAFPPKAVDGLSPVGSANGLTPLIQLSSVPEPSLGILICYCLLAVHFFTKKYRGTRMRTNA